MGNQGSSCMLICSTRAKNFIFLFNEAREIAAISVSMLPVVYITNTRNPDSSIIRLHECFEGRIYS